MTIDHLDILETQILHWPDEAHCQQHAEHVAACPQVREALIELHGDLGAGKTTWVRHLLHALGVPGRIKSPTYALAERYDVGGLPIHHFDFYRFADPREWRDAGLRDAFAAPGLKLVEWPEKAGGLLPRPDLRLSLSLLMGQQLSQQISQHRGQDLNPEDDSGARQVRVEALTSLGQELMK